MTAKRKVAMWVLFGVAAAVIAAGFIMPLFTVEAKRGPLTDNLSNAKQVAIALRMYADDHENQFPKTLEEIMPKYCTSDKVLWNTVADGKTKARWQYSPDHKPDEEPIAIIITSSPNSKGQRVVGYTDGSAAILSAPQDTSR